MSDTYYAYFDYLSKCDIELEEALGLVDLSENVNYWRCSGLEHPDTVLVGCRKTVEAVLRELSKPLPDERMRIREIIDYAQENGVINKSMALKCNEIRRLGNTAAHEFDIEPVNAKMALELLDDFLRWNAEKLNLIPVEKSAKVSPDDSVFIIKTADELSDITSRAKLAAALSEDKAIEKKTRAVSKQVVSFTENTKSDLEKMAELLSQARSIATSNDSEQNQDLTAMHKEIVAQCEKSIENIVSHKEEVSTQIDELNTEIDEILSEHDFIQKLLHGGNRATEKQLDVMAFPRGSNAVTNILQIAGGAGTGKTLCLLAKIISEIDKKGQGVLFEEDKKKALFICFNKKLAKYVRDILAGYKDRLPEIEVAHYDEYINQLVRWTPKQGFAHLAEYASNVRYSGGKIIYKDDNPYNQMLKQAQDKVASCYPNRAKDYYLNSSNEDEQNWLKDELSWIEIRFMNDNDAEDQYPSAERVGRGTKHRPNEEIRRIILEIRKELNDRLEKSGRYTIEQATKRLFSANSLPSYDAIAIDEVQDFSLLSIKLLLRFRRNNQSKVFISGDENQKIYRRDFSWKELDEDLKGHTITLEKNMRNSPAIRRFSDRLLGIKYPRERASRNIHIENVNDERIVSLLRKLIDSSKKETTALITGRQQWYDILRKEQIPLASEGSNTTQEANVYVVGDLGCKGLEFDNVVVDYAFSHSEDEEEEKRLRYVHFTRARKRLYIGYQDSPPELLVKYYEDFLS